MTITEVIYIAYTSLDGDNFWIPAQEFGKDFYDFKSAESYGAIRSLNF